MNIADRFIEQHHQIVSLCNELMFYAHKDHIGDNVGLVITIQENLGEILGSHLRLEDLSLYPMLLEHKDIAIRETAALLKQEVSGCAHLYNIYREKYPTRQSIEDHINSYIEDTNKMISSILQRNKREEIELYSLLR